MARLSAADLTTRDGKVYRNYTVIGHDVGFLTILYADGGGKIPLSNLPTELQAKYGYDPVKSDQFVQQEVTADRKARDDVAQAELTTAQQDRAARQKYLAAQTAAAGPAVSSAAPADASPLPDPSQPLTGIAAKLNGSLLTAPTGIPHQLDAQTLAGVKYWAFYYSASWCPPCRAFTPSLVSFYNSFKPSHPQFELIFVNQDNSEDDMLSYMKGDAMPWPAVRFLDVRNSDASKYCGSGIPCLVLVDATGKVLSDSFQGKNYLGPEHVVDDIRSMVK